MVKEQDLIVQVPCEVQLLPSFIHITMSWQGTATAHKWPQCWSWMCFSWPGEDWGQRQGGDPPACPCWPLSQSSPQWCWQSFHQQCQADVPIPVLGLRRCPAGCAQTAQLCPAVELWTPHGAQHCLHPALCHCYPTGDGGKGLASRLQTAVALITGGRTQSWPHLKGFPNLQRGVQLLGHIVSS